MSNIDDVIAEVLNNDAEKAALVKAGVVEVTEQRVIIELAKVGFFGKKETNKVKALDSLAKYFSAHLSAPEGIAKEDNNITISFEAPKKTLQITDGNDS